MSSSLSNNTHQQSGAFALDNNAVAQVAASGVQVALDNQSASAGNQSTSVGTQSTSVDTSPLLDAAKNQESVFKSAFYADSDIYAMSADLKHKIENQPSSQQEPERRVPKVTHGDRQQESYGTPWRPATRIVASGRQTIALCPDREQSQLAPPNGLTRSIADPEAFESNQRQIQADKLAKSNNGTCELEYEEEHFRQTFYMTLSVIYRPGNHAMPLPTIYSPWFRQAIDDNKSSKGYMLLMRTHARNIGAEFNADYLSHTYWLQSNPEGMTHAAYFDYPYQAMYEWVHEASCDVNTDLLLKFQDRQCAICLEKIAMNGCIKGCTGDGGKRHLFHDHCLQTWIETGHRDCPTCRGELFSDIQKIGENTWTKIWTWFPSNYRLAEEPAEESKSEPAETIQQCLNRMANETDDQQFKDLLIVYSLEVQAAYEVYLEDRDWDKFKDTCRHCVFHWREREQKRRQIQQCLNRMANETDDQQFKHLLIVYSLEVGAAYEVYLQDRDWEEFKETCRHCVFHWRARGNSPAALEERQEIQQYLDRMADETNDEGLKDLLGKPDDDIVYSAYHNFLENNSWEQFKDICTGFLADFVAEEERRHLEYLDHQANVNGVATQIETLQQCLIRLADETNDTGYLYNGFSSFRLVPSNRGAQTAYEVYLVDRNWEEFKDTCTRFLGYFRENIGNTLFNEDLAAHRDYAPEGSGEPAHSERVESEARSSFWDEETPEQLLVEDIQQCCIRLAHETNDHGFKHLLYQYNDLVVKAAYEVYLEDRDWGEFKDTCTHIMAHFRAENDHEETPEGSERVESEARSSFWDDENNWTDDFVPSMRSIAERDDYETDPEDRTADLNDY